MIQIRSNVFETNSSSTHSICIPKKTKPTVNFVDFEIGEYGWESGMADPASYLYTAILDVYSYDEAQEKIDELTDILNRYDIAYRFEKPVWAEYGDGEKYLDNGYIDHAYETRGFVETVLNDEDALLRYLSSGIVYTGNDNQDDDDDMCYVACSDHEYHDEESYDYFYKGN